MDHREFHSVSGSHICFLVVFLDGELFDPASVVDLIKEKGTIDSQVACEARRVDLDDGFD